MKHNYKYLSFTGQNHLEVNENERPDTTALVTEVNYLLYEAKVKEWQKSMKRIQISPDFDKNIRAWYKANVDEKFFPANMLVPPELVRIEKTAPVISMGETGPTNHEPEETAFFIEQGKEEEREKIEIKLDGKKAYLDMPRFCSSVDLALLESAIKELKEIAPKYLIKK